MTKLNEEIITYKNKLKNCNWAISEKEIIPITIIKIK
jgi:hypothetical protein